MDFGKILDQWETQGCGVYDKDSIPETEEESAAERRRRLLRKRPDGTIDLHGLTREEALTRLDHFFSDAKTRGLEKLLVIHGKGSHPGSSGVLRKLVRDFIESCPFAGESGHSSGAGGGTGSTWVLLKA
ncbi:MAG: Smr/MutS family protein [Treponema sp.]|jgi:DNA-nicking Smr family endonuclease|nr:Smr/MutS family protein [Treponema sp.]